MIYFVYFESIFEYVILFFQFITSILKMQTNVIIVLANLDDRYSYKNSFPQLMKAVNIFLWECLVFI